MLRNDMEYNTELKSIYGVSPEEMQKINLIYESSKSVLNLCGYQEMKSPMIYKKDGYIKSTKVHLQNMFFAERFRGDTSYVIQSDAIIGMTDVLTNIDGTHILKMFQLGEILRDHIKSSDRSFRRDFFQLVSGVWGGTSFYYDAELIFANAKILNTISQFKVKYILMSNLTIFDVFEQGLSSRIRFNGIDSIDIDDQDFQILRDNFKMYINHNKFSLILSQIKRNDVKQEIQKLLDISEMLKTLNCSIPVFYSLKNLHGTGYYSGITYQIYGDIGESSNVLLADGGRIDSISKNFVKNKLISVCCMGIGLTYLTKFMNSIRNIHKVIILTDEIYLYKAIELKNRIQENEDKVIVSIFPMEKDKWKYILKDEHYQECIFVLVHNNGFELRNGTDEQMQKYSKYIASI